MQTLLLVSHTHWDREWYLTFEEYRTRLVATYDGVLDVLERVPGFHSFAFDGQTVPVDDYLEIRPEAHERLKTQVKARRLFVGPLYVIPDGYAPTGEAWVRNFLLGLARCADLGGDPGYVYMAEPTSLPEQFPQIVRRFGYDSAVFGRGLVIATRDGSNPHIAKSEYYWEGGDGSRLLVVHMPAAYDDENGAHCILHYCNAAEVFWGPEYDPLRKRERTIRIESPDDAFRRIAILREYLTPLATSEMLLFMQGCDHLPPQPDTPALIERINERLDDAKLVHGTFSDYLEAVRKSADPSIVRQGESRGRGGAMSRVFLRRFHSETLTLLERWMEPSAALAWLARGSGAPDDGANLSDPTDRGLMRQAWRYAMQNLAHDTIWGCSIDEVYDEVIVRFAKSRQIAEEIVGQALELLAERVNTLSLAGERESRPCAVFSSSCWNRSEVFEAEFWLPPGAKGTNLAVIDDGGKRWLAQVLSAKPAVRRTDRFRHTAWVEPVTAVRALVLAEDLPPLGYRTVAVGSSQNPPESPLAVGATWMENEHIRVDVHPDGSFDLTDRATGRTAERLNRLTDEGDCGNGWRFERVEHDRLFGPDPAQGSVEVIERGPVRASIEVRFAWELPEGLTDDGRGRAGRLVACPLTVRISLLAGKSRVHVHTSLDNRARNHRLRAHFPTGIRADITQADGAFAVHERPIYLTDRKARKSAKTGIGFHPSTPEETAMMWSFVDASDEGRGFALLTNGVPQYEVRKDRDGAVVFVLTLMRAAVGHTHLHDPDRTHGGQCPGEQTAEYAVFLHPGDWLAGGVHREAESYLSPPRMVHTTPHDGPEPTTGSWLEPLPPEIMLTATKRSEDGKSLVLRLVNLVREEFDATVAFKSAPMSVCRANLREEFEQPLNLLPDGSVRIRFAPMEIVTLRLDGLRASSR